MEDFHAKQINPQYFHSETFFPPTCKLFIYASLFQAQRACPWWRCIILLEVGWRAMNDELDEAL